MKKSNKINCPKCRAIHTPDSAVKTVECARCKYSFDNNNYAPPKAEIAKDRKPSIFRKMLRGLASKKFRIWAFLMVGVIIFCFIGFSIYLARQKLSYGMTIEFDDIQYVRVLNNYTTISERNNNNKLYNDSDSYVARQDLRHPRLERALRPW